MTEQATPAAEVIATEAAAVETVTTETEVVPSWYNTHLGVDSEDAATQKLEFYKTLEQQQESLRAKEQDYDSKLNLFAQVEKDPDPEMVALEGLKAKGVPLKVATQIMDVTREELQSNPLEALILAEAMKNPTKFKEMGRAGIEQALRETYNLEESGEYTATARMKSDAFDAILAIENSKKDIAEVKNPITFAKENAAKAQQVIEARQAAAIVELEKVASTMTEVSYKYGEKSIPLKVTREEVDKVFENQKSFLGAAFDTSTKDGKEALKSYVQEQVIISKVKSGELFVEWENSYAADVARGATQESLNGQVKTINRATPEGGKSTLSPIAQVAQEQGHKLTENMQKGVKQSQ